MGIWELKENRQIIALNLLSDRLCKNCLSHVNDVCKSKNENNTCIKWQEDNRTSFTTLESFYDEIKNAFGKNK